MIFGCCGSMVAREKDGTGVEIAEQLREIGYDYIEMSLAHMMALSSSDFDALKKRLDHSGLRCEACNNFFPPHIRLTGEDVKMGQILDYVKKAFDRASRFGVAVIVFGSAGAKNVPEDFPKHQAWIQIVQLLQAIDPIAKEHGITVAIEPLNKLESNIVNTVAEALRLAREANGEQIKLVVDYYHLMMEKESPQIITKAGDFVRHLHFAEVEGRVFPKKIKRDYEVFFANLKEIGYTERLSIEAFSENIVADASQSLSLLKKLESGV